MLSLYAVPKDTIGATTLVLTSSSLVSIFGYSPIPMLPSSSAS